MWSLGDSLSPVEGLLVCMRSIGLGIEIRWSMAAWPSSYSLLSLAPDDIK